MSNAKLVFSWLLVGIPLAYGVFQTLTKAAALFG
ncbi:MFS transporter small subunit [Arthrobacter sp. 3Tela_A]